MSPIDSQFDILLPSEDFIYRYSASQLYIHNIWYSNIAEETFSSVTPPLVAPFDYNFLYLLQIGMVEKIKKFPYCESVTR